MYNLKKKGRLMLPRTKKWVRLLGLRFLILASIAANVSPYPVYEEETMKESWKELCEIEGIKFYDTPEMGVVCRVSEINRAVTGEANRNNFKRDILHTNM